MDEINKISVIGGPGTGKTTLAIRLSHLYQIPQYHIDGIHHLKNWKKRNKVERDNLILEIVKKDSWIIDGTYKDTLEERIKRSELVIFLDYTSFAQLRGVCKRIFTNYNKERKEIPGCKEKANFTFIKQVLKFNKTKRQTIMNILEKYNNHTIIIIKNRKELNEWIKTIEE